MMPRKVLLDPQDPFYRPLWLRVAIVAACLGWAVFELLSGGPFWAMLFGAAGLYAAYQFFVVFDPQDPDERKEE